MSATKPATKEELKAYCLRRLGYPAIDINVCDEQLDDLIQEAIAAWQEFSYEGSYVSLIRIQVNDNIRNAAHGATPLGTTAWEELDNYIQLPPNVIGINNVFTGYSNSTTVPGNIFNIKYQIFLNDIYGFAHGELLHYFMTSQYLETIDWVTNSPAHRRVRWTVHQNRLYLDFDWKATLTNDNYILVECVMALDPDVYPDAYNNEWLKGYTEALFQQQWGQNLSKYDGIQMIGGVTLNGRQILEDGRQKKEALIQDLRSTYSLPPLDLIG